MRANGRAASRTRSRAVGRRGTAASHDDALEKLHCGGLLAAVEQAHELLELDRVGPPAAAGLESAPADDLVALLAVELGDAQPRAGRACAARSEERL